MAAGIPFTACHSAGCNLPTHVSNPETARVRTGLGKLSIAPEGHVPRTLERLRDEFECLDNLCAIEMIRVIGMLRARL